jgi:2-(1,2-epoxy-1,2-dihydrophenyl)acetyl-CoA isomerase
MGFRESAKMNGDSVLLRHADGIATVMLSRPERLNALNLASAEELLAKLQICAADDEAEAVILTGTGSGFCAGGDLKAIWEHIRDGKESREFFREITSSLNRCILAIRRMEKLVFAAVNGVASGMGMSLALACDVRIGSEKASFRQGFTSMGLVPDGGWTLFMPQIIGASKALEMLLADPSLDAKQAASLGLLSEIVPADQLLERTNRVARRVVKGSKTSIAGSKALINDALFPNLEQQMELERQRIIFQGGTQEFVDKLKESLGVQDAGEDGSFARVANGGG